MKWNSVVGALFVGVALCSPSYGFEWLDRLIGIDLDNSEATSYYPQYSAGYAPYGVSYATPASTPTYSPYIAGYPATAGQGCSCAPAAVPQTTYRTVYRPVPVTVYQPVAACGPCGNQTTTMRPVVTYRMQPQVVPYVGNQPTYAPGYAPAVSGSPTGN